MLLAKEMGAKRLLAKSDSVLVTRQVTGEYQANDPHMAAYPEYVRILKEAFFFGIRAVTHPQRAECPS